MEIGFAYLDPQHGARHLAEFDHRIDQLRVERYRPAPADTQSLVDAGDEEDHLQLAAALDDVPETVDTVVAGAVGLQQQVRFFVVDKADASAARRYVDAAVGTRGCEHAEWRHRDEVLRMHVDRWPRLGDDARGRLRIDRGEVSGRDVGQGGAPVVLRQASSVSRLSHHADWAMLPTSPAARADARNRPLILDGWF